MDNPNKKYGVQRKTITAFNGLKNVLESRNVIDQLKQIADEEIVAVLQQILDLPDDHPKWEYTIATLIGQARTHRTYSELYTIKEK